MASGTGYPLKISNADQTFTMLLARLCPVMQGWQGK
jgi:hypothetical protein